ncbi:MAG: hypothetical protein A3E87_08980 [Gammaproteobacteria bacterium RIFCSPHIGHO2_12_FULL_35_23]|nr:MAG: hypothetical protein A3E87_08980 [Gammaproteobacteria bacterium RIFCSPHIGHO2_12_FULL_35_23]
MLARLLFQNQANPITIDFLKQLKQLGFSGEINTDAGTRLLNATDNSAYQVLPQAVLFPRNQTDIEKIFKLAAQKQFKTASFIPRGGGTSTNGQSLGEGIIIDCSKYMTKILELNLQEGWVRVEPGVVLDQLNDYLKSQGVFFAPHLSPSSRATLGGMASTDACGKGSIVYGKTSNHIIALTAVYSDGSLHTSQAITLQELAHLQSQTNLIGEIYRQVNKTVINNQEQIASQFPHLTRFMTGYDLAHVYNEEHSLFNLNSILTGSEGTLAIITELKLKLTPLPKFKHLLVLQYDSFHKALLHAKNLIATHPVAIETVDHTILELAKTDLIYSQVKDYIVSPKAMTQAINLVEFTADQEAFLINKTTKLQQLLATDDEYSFAYKLVTNENTIKHLWHLREKSVGLLGKVTGKRKPTSGVEDTVVPPEKLADFVQEFRALLDAKGLSYGMFGHVDAGCLHVRPALDLSNARDEVLYHEISDEVALLTKKYGGLMWGEHGKGYRSQYMPMFFGTKLYEEIRKIKKSFDPFNQLNPGKIATPIDFPDTIIPITTVKRGHFDKQINSELKEIYQGVMSCNGNGACFNYSAKAVMCPSYKASRDRRYSPKGRASLIREWLRLISLQKPQTNFFGSRFFNTFLKRLGYYDFSHEVYDSLHTCLGCKACATECPVNVDIPTFKAKFLESYHSRYLRSIRARIIAFAEPIAYFQQQTPIIWNSLLKNKWLKILLKKTIKLVDPPLLSSPNLKSLIKQHNIPIVTLEQLQALNFNDSKRTIVVIQDWLTSFYQVNLVVSYYHLLRHLGFQVYLLKWFANGKPLQVNGYLPAFKKLASKNAKTLSAIAALNIPMIGIDPSITLTYRNEYVEALGPCSFKVLLIQEWLAEQNLTTLKSSPTKPLTLLLHCTEQTYNTQLSTLWLQVFSKLGIPVNIPAVGCCGMAGTFGHELEQQTYSQKLYHLSWKKLIEENPYSAVTGFSCHGQIKRLHNKNIFHPVEYLCELLTQKV